ncbi:MAG: polysaccharide lyase 6 family protein [Bacteroidales bacterium]|nr:polysaccharide lyase 6 family protein [Bacteroidales bacterium]
MITTLFVATALFLGSCADIAQESGKEYVVSSAQEFSALKLSAGDTVVWKDGVYENVNIKLSATGRENAPVVLRSESVGGVKFVGGSSITLNGSYLQVSGFDFVGLDTSVKKSILTFAKGSSHCKASSCLIDGRSSAESKVDTKWISLYGTENEVSGCSFIDKKNMGCLLVVWLEDGIVPRHTISNNYFTRPCTLIGDNGKAANGQECIRIGTSDFSLNDACCLVTGNFFYRCHGEMAEIISNKSCGNVYQGNYFSQCKGSLTLRHGNRCVVRGNYFTADGVSDVGAIRIIGEDHLVEDNVMVGITGKGYKSAICLVRGESNAALNGYWTVKNAIIRNNWIINCQSGMEFNYSGRDTQDTAPKGTKVQNNTIICSGNQASLTLIDMFPSAIKWTDNVIYGGVQNGVSLKTVKEAPTAPDYESAISQIVKNAGRK